MAWLPACPALPDPARLRLRLLGGVQGVGLRPAIWRLSQRWPLAGWVRNDGDGACIELEGARADLHAWLAALPAALPPLAQVDHAELSALPHQGEAGFAVIDSQPGAGGGARLPPDLAPCPACLAELFDPSNRRWRHPFINCTDCGPRFSVSRRLPYDRAHTSLAGFALCADCAGEYRQPADRRFHAEPIACPHCGPRLSLCDLNGSPVAGDALSHTVALLRAGQIVAIKGVGGFHLVCDADQPQAVAMLRARKRRPAKPLAVMALNADSLADVADIAPLAARWLNDPSRPVVLSPARAGLDALWPGIAPGVGRVGAVLPMSPLHYLLFHEAAGRPSGVDWLTQPHPLRLVFTSANLSGAPLITDNAQALRDLAGLADFILLHDREIVARCDDSVLAVRGARQVWVRRARGRTPTPLAAAPGEPVLALGAQLKNTLTVASGSGWRLSQHLGDLDHPDSWDVLEDAVRHWLTLTGAQPTRIAHDRHPDALSSRLAAELALRFDAELIPVQHHHAHLAAVLAEHHWPADQPVLGLALDGFGLGDDGGAWGGELLRVRGADCQRLGRLRPLALPGGDIAARQPWRMAASALAALGHREADIAARLAAHPGAAAVAAMLARGVNCPPTSSLGRAFDAVAALAGVCTEQSYESEAAQKLEAHAQGPWPAPDPALWRLADDASELDLRPLLARISTLNDAHASAALWHANLAAALAHWAHAASQRQGVRHIALAGGVCLNLTLLDALCAQLTAAGLTPLLAIELPPNDGGVSLGQAWVARHLGR